MGVELSREGGSLGVLASARSAGPHSARRCALTGLGLPVNQTRRVAAALVRLRPDRFTLLLSAIAFLGSALSLARQVSYGPGLEWDSVAYVSVARNLLAGDGFVQFNGNMYTLWPPLYPLLLAAGGLGGLDPYAVAGPLNAIIFGLTVFVAGRWLGRRLETRFLALWGCLAIALSFHLVRLSSYALSEPVFILLTLMALIQADKYLDEGRRSALVWAGIFAGLACLTRYAGVAVVVTVGLLLISQRAAALPQKLRRAVLYGLIAAAPIAVWMMRNFLIDGTLTGKNRFKVPSPLPELMNDLLTTMGSLVIPGFVDGGIRLAAEYSLGLVLASFAAAVVFTFVRGHRQREGGQDWRAFYLFGGFALSSVVLYVVSLLVGATWDGVQTRHLMPLYIPLLLAGLFALDRFAVYERSDLDLSPGAAGVNTRTIVRGGGGGRPGLGTLSLAGIPCCSERAWDRFGEPGSGFGVIWRQVGRLRGSAARS